MTAKPPLDPWIEGYLGYVADVRRNSHRTVIEVRCSLRRVSVWAQAAHPETPLWQLTFPQYLGWLQHERQLGTQPANLAKFLSHLRGLLDYAWRSGRSDRNVLDGFQLQEAPRTVAPPCLTEEEARRLVEACPSRTGPERRERMVVLLLYGCGLRTSELCGLRLCDIDRERMQLLIARGKGDRQRVVPIPSAVYTELLAYLVERGGQKGFLLRGSSSRSIDAREVGRVVRSAAERAGITTRVTPKVLRHSFATHLMDRGVDLAVIASLMGHRSPKETGVYLHALGAAKESAVQRLDSQGPT